MTHPTEKIAAIEKALNLSAGTYRPGSAAAESMELGITALTALAKDVAAMEAERQSLVEALAEAIALTYTPEHAQDQEWYHRVCECKAALAAAAKGHPDSQA
jgi:hypothetical protein